MQSSRFPLYFLPFHFTILFNLNWTVESVIMFGNITLHQLLIFTVHCGLMMLIRRWSLWMFSCLWHNWRHCCPEYCANTGIRGTPGMDGCHLSSPVGWWRPTTVDISVTVPIIVGSIELLFTLFPAVLPYILINYWCVVSDNLEDDKWTTINCSLWGTIIFINEFNIC